MSKFIDFEKIKLNTVELETWLYPNWKIEDFCNNTIDWKVLDCNIKDFFSIQSKRFAFWDNYKDNNQIETINSDWETENKNIPTIINWWMWTNVSSASLVEAMNKLWFWWHLSSIWIWMYYFYERYKNRFNKDFKWNNSLDNIVQTEFDIIFKDELWLSDEFIKKHFFVCDELCDEKNPNKKNKWFNWELAKERTSRMMDLVATYRQTKDLKSRENNVWINCMYKTSSYIASLKIAALCWIDYVTTAAWNPTKNPKEILKDFSEDLKKEWKTCSIPAMWLLVSSSKILVDFDYDYYTFEEWALAWWHILRLSKDDKFKELKLIKDKFIKAWKKIPPFYAAWWVSTNKEIKEVLDYTVVDLDIFIKIREVLDGKKLDKNIIKEIRDGLDCIGLDSDIIKEIRDGLDGKKLDSDIIKRIKDALIVKWFDWVQIWTIAAVSEEACDGDWKEFKERLIWWNHLWENTEIDTKFFEWVDQAKQGFEKIVGDFNKQILSILDKTEIEQETPEIKRVRDYLYKVVYNAFFDEKIDKLSDKEQEYYNKIKEFFYVRYKWKTDKIKKVFRDMWNAMKFLQEFEKYVKENWKKPTMLVFDSTAWFPGRTKIIPKMYEVIAWNVKPTWCTWCLTDCICAWRWSVREDRWSKFCIYNWLNYLNPDKNIAFSWRSTVPYAEIRPIRDSMAYLMGTYVKRK